MDLIAIGGVVAVLVGLLVAFAIGAGVFFLVARSWIKVAKVDEALVIVGKKKGAAGTSHLTVVPGGRAIVNPVLHRHTLLSLRSRQVSLNAEAQSLDNVTVNVDGVAIVKIGSSSEQVQRAAERFASQDKAIEQFTTEQLEGALRGVVATLSVVELMRDRKKFADQIAADVSKELEDQGLVLDSFQIKGITDNVGYIASLGAPEIQAKRQSAEIAKTNADRGVNQRRIATDEQNLIEQTQLDQNKAQAAADVGRARAEAEQAENLARAKAQQAVLAQEAENKQAQLDAEVKRVADADLYDKTKKADAIAYSQEKAAEADRKVREQQADAESYVVRKKAEAAQQAAAAEAAAVLAKAQAEAEAIRLTGEARADAVKAEAAALAENQNAVLSRQVIEILPELMTQFAQGYASVGQITVIGGDASTHLAGEQAAGLRATFDTVRAATGLDLGAVIQGQAVGRGIASGGAFLDLSNEKLD